MKNRLRTLVATALILSATVAFGANEAGQFSISPVIGGYTFEGGKQHLKTGLVYGARAGYNFTKAFGAEALFDYAFADSTAKQGKADLFRYGGDLLYHFMPENNLVPYLAAGFSGLSFHGANINRKTHGAFDYGAGLKYFITENIALRGDVRHILYSFKSTTYNNLEYTLGAYIPFGSAAKSVKPLEPVMESAAPKAAPAAVAEPAPPAPAPPVPPSSSISVTPASIEKGQTAKLAWDSKDTTGCNIQPGIGSVSTSGSMSVTPSANTSYTLSCSGAGGSSTSGTYIEVASPPPPKAAPAPVAMSAQKAAAAKRFCDKPAVISVLFDTNKADIKPKYTADLKVLGEFLNDFPHAKGEISGHTDNVGSNEYNMKLSQRRAESVEKYLEKTFKLAPNRVTTKGYGETKPIASNKTKKGKAQNRRIETNFSCN